MRYKLLKKILDEIVKRSQEQSRKGVGGSTVAFTPPKHLTHLSLTFEEV